MLCFFGTSIKKAWNKYAASHYCNVGGGENGERIGESEGKSEGGEREGSKQRSVRSNPNSKRGNSEDVFIPYS